MEQFYRSIEKYMEQIAIINELVLPQLDDKLNYFCLLMFLALFFDVTFMLYTKFFTSFHCRPSRISPVFSMQSSQSAFPGVLNVLKNDAIWSLMALLCLTVQVPENNNLNCYSNQMKGENKQIWLVEERAINR